MSCPVTSSLEPRDVGAREGGGRESDQSVKAYVDRERQHLVQGREVIIKASDLFAQTVLGTEQPLLICGFLQNLDVEETKEQAREEVEIEQREIQERNFLTGCFGCTTGVVGGILVLGVLKNIFEMTIPFSGLIGAIAGLIMGVASAVMCHHFNGFGRARPNAEIKLEIQNHRAIRLEDKIRAIAEQRKVLLEKPPEDLRQLSRTEEAFTNTIMRYKGAYS